jgi:hypothetical protein
MTESHEQKLARLARLKTEAEAAYDKMYNVHTDNDTRLQFDLAEEMLIQASRLATELGMEDESKSLRARCQHIRNVYRHQFRRST